MHGPKSNGPSSRRKSNHESGCRSDWPGLLAGSHGTRRLREKTSKGMGTLGSMAISFPIWGRGHPSKQRGGIAMNHPVYGPLRWDSEHDVWRGVMSLPHFAAYRIAIYPSNSAEAKRQRFIEKVDSWPDRIVLRPDTTPNWKPAIATGWALEALAGLGYEQIGRATVRWTSVDGDSQIVAVGAHPSSGECAGGHHRRPDMGQSDGTRTSTAGHLRQFPCSGCRAAERDPLRPCHRINAAASFFLRMVAG